MEGAVAASSPLSRASLSTSEVAAWTFAAPAASAGSGGSGAGSSPLPHSVDMNAFPIRLGVSPLSSCSATTTIVGVRSGTSSTHFLKKAMDDVEVGSTTKMRASACLAASSKAVEVQLAGHS